MYNIWMIKILLCLGLSVGLSMGEEDVNKEEESGLPGNEESVYTNL